MMREVAHDVSLAIIPQSGHWIAEENPNALAQVLCDFGGLDQCFEEVAP
jgi:pimeloyl-ACP methyl ester carboxylesterase